MSSNEEDQRLLTRKEVEERFGVKARYLELAVSSGEGPAITRIGRSVFYQTCDVRAWIDNLSADGEQARG